MLFGYNFLYLVETKSKASLQEEKVKKMKYFQIIRDNNFQISIIDK